ncbi:hypothetical protein F0562_020108 [Nyssa sinensis]|uniref:Uncharacterized protein n=1 Tax=Nyssa sinensis TaxID=561372 RepID=A0A5J5BRK7_9ASTE|nr:hypothetical protein F0562_020108 [Nyssa sinensis]
MASETVASDHSTAPEQEKKENEEVKTIEPDNVSPSKESGEEEKAKAEEIPSLAAPLAESEEKIEDKQVEPLVIKDTLKGAPVEDTLKGAPESIPEEKTKTSGVSEPEADGVKSQPEERPAIESVEKHCQEEHPKVVDVPESLVEAVEKKDEQVEALHCQRITSSGNRSGEFRSKRGGEFRTSV